MPSTIRNAPLWEKHCRKVRALAQRVILGEVGVIEGSRQMLTYKRWLHAHEDDDFRIFVIVDTESHHLPLGEVRALWQPAALKEKDQEIKKLEDLYRQEVLESASRIKAKYERK